MSMKIKIKRSNFGLLMLGALVIGIFIGCIIASNHADKNTVAKCNHKFNTLIEQSVTYHCNQCSNPAQRILYDSKNNITYVYTFYYTRGADYSHKLELKDTEILRIQADGTSVIVEK